MTRRTKQQLYIVGSILIILIGLRLLFPGHRGQLDNAPAVMTMPTPPVGERGNWSQKDQDDYVQSCSQNAPFNYCVCSYRMISRELSVLEAEAMARQVNATGEFPELIKRVDYVCKAREGGEI